MLRMAQDRKGHRIKLRSVENQEKKKKMTNRLMSASSPLQKYLKPFLVKTFLKSLSVAKSGGTGRTDTNGVASSSR